MSTPVSETDAEFAAPEKEGQPERSAPGSPSPDDARFVHHLHFEHLRNLTTLSVSATGGGLIALQAGLLDLGPATAIPLVCFAFAAVLSLLTQRTLIRDLGGMAALGLPPSGRSAGDSPGPAVPSRAFVAMSEVSSMLFGAGVGSAAMILLVDRLL